MRRKGTEWEDAAASYLSSLGWRILARNYRSPYGEIDIVAEEEGVLAFVEVKARRSVLHGSPREAVDARKRRRITATALRYLSEWGATGAPEPSCRFDVVSADIGPDGMAKLTLLRGAFEAEE